MGDSSSKKIAPKGKKAVVPSSSLKITSFFSKQSHANDHSNSILSSRESSFNSTAQISHNHSSINATANTVTTHVNSLQRIKSNVNEVVKSRVRDVIELCSDEEDVSLSSKGVCSAINMQGTPSGLDKRKRTHSVDIKNKASAAANSTSTSMVITPAPKRVSPNSRSQQTPLSAFHTPMVVQVAEDSLHSLGSGSSSSSSMFASCSGGSPFDSLEHSCFGASRSSTPIVGRSRSGTPVPGAKSRLSGDEVSVFESVMNGVVGNKTASKAASSASSGSVGFATVKSESAASNRKKSTTKSVKKERTVDLRSSPESATRGKGSSKTRNKPITVDLCSSPAMQQHSHLEVVSLLSSSGSDSDCSPMLEASLRISEEDQPSLQSGDAAVESAQSMDQKDRDKVIVRRKATKKASTANRCDNSTLSTAGHNNFHSTEALHSEMPVGDLSPLDSCIAAVRDVLVQFLKRHVLPATPFTPSSTFAVATKVDHREAKYLVDSVLWPRSLVHSVDTQSSSFTEGQSKEEEMEAVLSEAFSDIEAKEGLIRTVLRRVSVGAWELLRPIMFRAQKDALCSLNGIRVYSALLHARLESLREEQRALCRESVIAALLSTDVSCSGGNGSSVGEDVKTATKRTPEALGSWSDILTLLRSAAIQHSGRSNCSSGSSGNSNSEDSERFSAVVRVLEAWVKVGRLSPDCLVLSPSSVKADNSGISCNYSAVASKDVSAAAVSKSKKPSSKKSSAVVQPEAKSVPVAEVLEAPQSLSDVLQSLISLWLLGLSGGSSDGEASEASSVSVVYFRDQFFELVFSLSALVLDLLLGGAADAAVETEQADAATGSNSAERRALDATRSVREAIRTSSIRSSHVLLAVLRRINIGGHVGAGPDALQHRRLNVVLAVAAAEQCAAGDTHSSNSSNTSDALRKEMLTTATLISESESAVVHSHMR